MKIIYVLTIVAACAIMTITIFAAGHMLPTEPQIEATRIHQ